ncbi:MAG: ABC transporter ATP-binding protein [Thermotaleaceae bacterium]
MLEIDNLKVNYSNKKGYISALNGINITIESGDICAIIGPSGCGKSTLLHVLSGIIKNYEGKIYFNSEVLDPPKYKIGFIPQNFGLLPWKNVQENCLLSLKIRGISLDPTLEKEIDYLMTRLNIHTLKSRYPHELSGGQKQRVSFARSLIIHPDLLLMDEPFSALDALTREDTQDLFKDMWDQYRPTTIFVTHSIDEALNVGKIIVIISPSPGQVVEIIDNPLFQTKNIRESKAFLPLFSHIRTLLKRI